MLQLLFPSSYALTPRERVVQCNAQQQYGAPLTRGMPAMLRMLCMLGTDKIWYTPTHHYVSSGGEKQQQQQQKQQENDQPVGDGFRY